MKHICLTDYTAKDIYVLHQLYKTATPTYVTDCYEAIYIAHGTGLYETKGKQLRAKEGDIFLIHPKTAHNVIPDPDLRGIEIYYCYFSNLAITGFQSDLTEEFTEFSDFLEHKTSLLHTADTQNKEIRDIMIRMIDEQLSMLPCRHNIIKGYLSIFLTKLLRAVQTCNLEKTYSHNMTVDIAIHYIYSRLYTKVSLADIAKHLRVSPSYVCRLFRKHLGMTPVQFINFLRVEKMKDILKNTDRPVSRIVEMFILENDYLRQIFKRQTGMTMQEYHDRYNYKYNPSDKTDTELSSSDF